MKNEKIKGLEKFDDIGEEDTIEEYEEIKKKKIKINFRKEAEKKENFMCESSSLSSKYCIYDTMEKSAYLAEEDRRTVRLWSSTTASLACGSTPASSPSTSVPAVASRAPFTGSRCRSLSPEFVRNINGTLCAGSQCRTADTILSKDDSSSQPNLLCWPMGEGEKETKNSRDKHKNDGKSEI
jgi:hypothetical protein